MRMSPSLRETAWDLLMTRTEEELTDIFYRLGEERFSRRVAAALKAAIEEKSLPNDSARVADVIRRAIPGKRGGIDPATRCFQALRIAVNGELQNLDRFLESIPDVLAPGGRVAILSFHSLEDRIVKQFFQRHSKKCVCPPAFVVCACGGKAALRTVTRKPLRPGARETASNPRSRSAKMRVAEKINEFKNKELA